MMGMILDGLPWFLGGDAEGSIVYVERAVAADPHYTHARVNLGKLYLKQGRVQAAKEQLLLVTKMQSPRGVYAWSHHHNPEALSLLKELEAQGEEGGGL
jgi:protein involved in temperature-dependent protein secretion